MARKRPAKARIRTRICATGSVFYGEGRWGGPRRVGWVRGTSRPGDVVSGPRFRSEFGLPALLFMGKVAARVLAGSGQCGMIFGPERGRQGSDFGANLCKMRSLSRGRSLDGSRPGRGRCCWRFARRGSDFGSEDLQTGGAGPPNEVTHPIWMTVSVRLTFKGHIVDI